MPDNTTPYDSSAYEDEVRRTIPFHGEMLTQRLPQRSLCGPSPRDGLTPGAARGALSRWHAQSRRGRTTSSRILPKE